MHRKLAKGSCLGGGQGKLPLPASAQSTACRRRAEGPSRGDSEEVAHTMAAARCFSCTTPRRRTHEAWLREARRRGLCAGDPHPRPGRPHTSSPWLCTERRAEGLNYYQTRRAEGREGTGKATKAELKGPGKGWERGRGGAVGPNLQGTGGGGAEMQPGPGPLFLCRLVPASSSTACPWGAWIPLRGQKSGSSSGQPPPAPRKPASQCQGTQLPLPAWTPGMHRPCAGPFPT